MQPTPIMENVWSLFNEQKLNTLTIARRLGIRESEVDRMLAIMREHSALRPQAEDAPPDLADKSSLIGAATFQQRIVKLLQLYKRPLTDHELAKMTGAQAGHVRDTLAKLEANGTIARASVTPLAFYPVRRSG